MGENKEIIDSHAHVYLHQFDEDRTEILARAEAEGVSTVLMPAIDSETHAVMLEVEAKYPICQSMMGLHPCSVKEDFEMELGIVRNYLEQRRFIAIGEIGLDFYWDKTFTSEQYEAFRQQCRLALQYVLPICIHSRNATDECIEVVREFPGIRGVFHCFSGNLDQARSVVELGFYLGIGGVATFKNGGLEPVLRELGLAQVILETDAPYLAPVPYRGKRNEPAYSALVAGRISEILQVPEAQVRRLTTENVKKLFSLG